MQRIIQRILHTELYLHGYHPELTEVCGKQGKIIIAKLFKKNNGKMVLKANHSHCIQLQHDNLSLMFPVQLAQCCYHKQAEKLFVIYFALEQIKYYGTDITSV